MSRASRNCVFPAVASSYHVKLITGTLLEWIRDHSSWRSTTPTTVIVFVLGRRSSKCYNTKISTSWYRSLFVKTKQPVIVSTQKRTIVIQYKRIVYFIADCTPLFLGKNKASIRLVGTFSTMQPWTFQVTCPQLIMLLLYTTYSRSQGAATVLITRDHGAVRPCCSSHSCSSWNFLWLTLFTSLLLIPHANHLTNPPSLHLPFWSKPESPTWVHDPIEM
jgi:hypothetical protein